MQNKGLIKVFAILFGIVSLYQLSFTFFANKVENNANSYAQSKITNNDGRALANAERKYIDSVANKEVIAGYTYNDIKDKEMNLGLDLRGGINAIIQVSVKDILIGLSNKSKNAVFNEALANANEAQKSAQGNYLDLFYEQFERLAGDDLKLSDPTIFGNKSLREKINFKNTNEEVKLVLQKEINTSINTSFEVLRSRIDKFGVVQPSIQRIGNSGRIQIELPGARDIDRVTKLITSTAELQFWQVHTNAEVQNFFINANDKVAQLLKDNTTVKATDTVKKEDNIDGLLGLSEKETTNTAQGKDLFSYLRPNYAQSEQQVSSLVAQARVLDTAKVNDLLSRKEIRALLPSNIRYVKFLWDYKSQAGSEESTDVIGLYAIKSNRGDKPTIDGDVIADASQEYDQLSNPVVSMTMNGVGTKKWAKMTGENVGKFVAVVLDNYVYTAPVVNGAITGGSTQISGGLMTIEEAQDISTVLKAGKLPAPARIIQAEVVGPSLGKEAISASMWSFGLAILLVLAWMIVYYGKAGLYANIALIVNILFIFGVLASFNSVLTLPGIAGIILTIGMSVDANVIIFERIKEGLAAGKDLLTATSEGFSVKGALSAIIDANITTFLTGLILYLFGTGPIKGFALTLMVGIATSLFTAIFITRLFVDGAVSKGTNLTFNTNISKNWFNNLNFEFISKRKIAYFVSGGIILAGLISIISIGLKQGVDFKGGRSYLVRFNQPMNATEVASTLKGAFGTSPEVKTYGNDNQLKITTVYKIDEEGKDVDDVVQTALFNGLKPYLGATTYENFKPGFEKAGNAVMSYMKVEPTIADDIKKSALWAVIGSLVIVFLYILLRFRKMSYSIGAVVAVFHDVLIVLGIFSIFYKFMPFDMEIGQSFIAAILTVVGYSLNDTVVIFDRIREFTQDKRNITAAIVNKALNSTLGRTINTSLTTLLVMLAIFFFGGDSIKGFMFALIVGVVVGTYSSLFVATPIMFDTTKEEEEIEETEEITEVITE